MKKKISGMRFEDYCFDSVSTISLKTGEALCSACKMGKVLVIMLTCLLIGMGNVMGQETFVKYLSGKGNTDKVLWDFYCSDGRQSGVWSQIGVPSCWELEGFGSYNYGHDKDKSSETGIYRTKFLVPETWRNQRILIVFEGSMTDTHVKVNGKQVGEVHQGAFYRFKRDITQFVKYGVENQLEVTVHKMSANESVNQAERKADFWVFGGIFRPVYLEVVPHHHIDYVAIDAKHQGDIQAEVFISEVLSNALVELNVFDDNDRLLGTITGKSEGKTKVVKLTGKIANVQPWSAEWPNLYRAQVLLMHKGKRQHVLNERIGFRTIEVKPRDGIYVNGEKIRFKGVNRHSFWPSSGRTTSEAISLADAMLIKDMNMNAVRMAHYPPDRHFLHVCDSLGLYVINELCAWQYPPYDTPVGQQLVRELITRDVNHPSILFWANGNEGGFNHDLDPLFHQFDIQKRPVLHPWDFFSDINTVHYIDYHSGIKNMFNGREIFMPTELLHGLYDGGHGAGLDDYWNLMLSHPLSAGMFLWDFTDQGVVRTDKDGLLDTDRDHGADGILGPYREKEGSYFTIKEVWAPVNVQEKFITPAWDGVFDIENRYHFTNTLDCSFSYRLVKWYGLGSDETDTFSSTIASPEVAPGNKGKLQLSLPDGWQSFDVLHLTIHDPHQQELFTWSYEITPPAKFAAASLGNREAGSFSSLKENADHLEFSAAGVRVTIDRSTGLLKEVVARGTTIPLANGPVLITDEALVCSSVTVVGSPENRVVEVAYSFEDSKRPAYKFVWSMRSDGLLELEYNYRPADKIRLAGVTFDFPELGVTGASLLANGPYRVYNNRLKGGQIGVWEKAYNNTITGESWDYPEFKGYYSHFYGMRLHCPTPFEVYTGTEDTFLHLFTPEAQQRYPLERNHTHPPYPKGNISFMEAIPAVGTKFGAAENYGPHSQPHRHKTYGSVEISTKLYFKF